MTDVRMADVDVGRVAYENFVWYAGHTDDNGQRRLMWNELPIKLQEAWRVAAYAAVGQQQKMSRDRR